MPYIWVEEDLGYDTPCQLWQGGRSGKYGWAGRHRMPAHRWRWITERGGIPAGMVIHHLCWQHMCVNLDHMDLVTHAEHRRLHPESAKRRRKLTDAQVEEIRHSKDSLRSLARRYGISHTYARSLREETGPRPRAQPQKAKTSKQTAGQRRGRPRRGSISENDFLIEDRGYSSPCWIWIGRDPDSPEYGKIRLPDGRPGAAHIAAYEQFVGPVPDGMHLDHLCRVKRCINPSHLDPVTPGDNVRRGSQAKLNWTIVHKILASDEPHTVLAEHYGVHPETIRFVRIGRTWRQ